MSQDNHSDPPTDKQGHSSNEDNNSNTNANPLPTQNEGSEGAQNVTSNQDDDGSKLINHMPAEESDESREDQNVTPNQENAVIDLDAQSPQSGSQSPQYSTSPRNAHSRPLLERSGGYEIILPQGTPTVHLINPHVEISDRFHAPMYDWVSNELLQRRRYTTRITVDCDKVLNQISSLPKKLYAMLGIVSADDTNSLVLNPKTQQPAISEEDSVVELTLNEETMLYSGEITVQRFHDCSYLHSRNCRPNFRLRIVVIDFPHPNTPLLTLISAPFVIRARPNQKVARRSFFEGTPRKRKRDDEDEDGNEKPRKIQKIQNK